MKAIRSVEAAGEPFAVLAWPKRYLAQQPALLRERVAKYDIPFVPFSTTYDRVILYRLSQEDRAREQTTAGGLVIPGIVGKETDPRAVLLKAGLQALDYFGDHNIELGDIVWPARFSGWEPDVLPRRPGEADGKQMLFVLAQDITGSVDGLEREVRGEVEIMRRPDGTHVYRRRGEKVDEGARRRDVPYRSV